MRPAGYSEEDWEECPECEGRGYLLMRFDEVDCIVCDGAGGWPANARRFDDEIDAPVT